MEDEEDETSRLKIIIPIVVILIIIITIIFASNANSKKSSSSNSNSNTNSSKNTTTSSVTQSDIEEAVEAKATSKLISEVKSDYSQYDVSNCKYKIGSTTKTDTTYKDEDVYSVCGTVYFYDKYGQYKKSATFEVTVYVDTDYNVTAKKCTIK